jgi:ubiquitin carboxyl-terminal hydrolase 7
LLGIPVLEQQDSQEFWKLLLPALNVRALTDLYQGAYEDYLRALDGSGRERRREEPFLDLSLEVGPSASPSFNTGSTTSDGSVMSGLHALFGPPETLRVSEGNGWRPEKGSDPVDAHKGSVLKVQGLPPILQLHLKRFQHDWTADTIRKLNDPVSFPLVLDLKGLCQQDGPNTIKSVEATIESVGEATAAAGTAAAMEQDVHDSRFVYDLQSIVVHAGEYGSGHYYAYVRPNVRGEGWYRFNDHRVEAVTYREVYADACGGRSSCPVPSEVGANRRSPADAQPRKGWLGRLRNAILSGGSKRESEGYGYGGRTSSAYLLQYVRRSDVPLLYELPEAELEQQ